jgi:urease accessory protein
VVNKVDLAPYVGVDLPLMLKEADDVRSGRPVVAISARGGDGVNAVMDVLEREVLFV